MALCVTRYNIISVEIGLYAKKTKTMQLLKPKDVPGAILRNNILLDNSLVELKRWLLCRGLPCTGNKNDIAARYTKRLLVQYFAVFHRLCLYFRIENCYMNGQGNTIKEIHPNQSDTSICKQMCFVIDGNRNLSIKKNHKYYFQVQL